MPAAPSRLRLDAELVRRQLARSRQHATELIGAGRVNLNGIVVSKAATAVTADSHITVRQDRRDADWASRGAHKLLGAFAACPDIDPAGRRCLDAGASTGGFTDVLLRHGAAEVVAVDVGCGQLIDRLRDDTRVMVYDRTNVRTLTSQQIGGPVDVAVADLSFISLTLVLPALIGCCRPGADLLLMVKPQFEVGRQRLGSGGVVRNPEYRIDAVTQVANRAGELGWPVRAVAASQLPGPAGNVEYFVHLRASGDNDIQRLHADIRRTVMEGPQ